MDGSGKEMVDQLASQMAGLGSCSDVVNVGDVLDERYQLAEIIGRGGCGVVFRALDLNLQRDVAVKVLSAEGLSQDHTFSRFEQESQILRRLHSPNTVYFYDYGMTPQQVPYIVMEFVVGKQLKSILETETSLPPKRAVAILMQVLSSLNEAHGYGFVHRDLKPSNIMLCQRMGFPDDFVKVLDFGIAKIFDANDSSSSSNNDSDDDLIDEDVAGTPKYMAPELFKNQPFTPQSDLYSLGCIAYEMLTGIAPFDAETLHATVAKHLFSDPPTMGEAFADYPNLVATVYKLLAKKASERFDSAQSVMEALEYWNNTALIPALADMALLDDIEDKTETTKRPDAGFFDPNGLPGQKQSQAPNESQQTAGADKSRIMLIVMVILAVVFVGAIVGIVVFWSQSTHTTSSDDAVLLPPPAHVTADNRVSEKTLSLVGFVMAGNAINSVAYGMQEREVLIHIDDLMYGYDALLQEPSEKPKGKEIPRKDSRHKRPNKTAKEELQQPVAPVTTFTIQYKPVNARYGIMNGTGSCSHGKCTIKPVNVNVPSRIVLTAEGYLPKNVILKPTVSSYNVELQRAPSD